MRKSSWRGAAVVLVLLLIPTSLLLVSLEFGHRKAALRFSQGPEVPTLDPHKMQDVSGGRIAGALFEGLAVFDPATAAPKPAVAHRWDVSDDGLVYAFHLRPEARWSDGSQVTAEDFRYSWRRALDARTGSPYNYMLFPVRGARAYVEATRNLGDLSIEEADARVEAAVAGLGIEAPSPTVLRVTLERPNRSFIDVVAFHTLLPVKRSAVEAAHRSPNPDADPSDPRWTHPGRIVSNGAYVLGQWKLKHRMRLVRNEHYWNRDHVRLPTIDVYPTESIETAYLQYELGQLDMITDVPNLAAEQLIKERQAGRRTDFHSFPYCGTYFFRFNCTRPPLDDRRVRLALSLALNRPEIVQRAARLGQPVAHTFVPPQIPWYQGPEGHARDVERARRLLAEAGFPEGRGFPQLRFLYNTSEANKRIAELAAEQWRRELGVNVTLQNIEWKVFLERMRALDYDMARSAWIADYLDPMSFLDMFVTDGGNNNTGWSHPDYDRLIAEAADAVNAGQQADIFRRAESILIEQDMPITPLYFYVSASLVRGHVKGYVPNPLNRIAFEDLWIEAGEGGP